MKDNQERKHSFFKKIFIILLIIFSILLYSRFISTSGLKVKEYKIEHTSITSNFHGLKIIHLSDIHYGRIINKKRMEEIVEKINFLRPDIVVLTGDLIDKDSTLTTQYIEELSNVLSRIEVSIGKYAIKGNHDYIESGWENIISNSGFIDLNNNYEYIYKDGYEPILLSGLSSMQDEIPFSNRYNTLQKEIKNESINSVYNILLIHEPDLINDINNDDYNLILAGHSHNGQIRLPIIGALIKPKGAQKYYDEYYKVNNTELYISSGLGTSNLDFRFFNRPSFNLYRLVKK